MSDVSLFVYMYYLFQQAAFLKVVVCILHCVRELIHIYKLATSIQGACLGIQTVNCAITVENVDEIKFGFIEETLENESLVFAFTKILGGIFNPADGHIDLYYFTRPWQELPRNMELIS
ncbi:uncharacterized protein LOC143237246 isoform X2 [Tachypleus tridentatus]|uniref:uncharacterized protein LOC143237246 isoform X2 n=1 Tax=Tachypleus tridentatus TaxID=6853 RepID=UPI003FCF6B3D